MSSLNTQPGHVGQDASASSLRFQKLWEDALKKYNGVTGSDLRRSPLFNKMLAANSAEEVVRILEEHKKGFKAFRAHGENARAVIGPVFTLTKLFVDAGGEITAASSAVPGGSAIFAAFGVFLEAVEKVSQRFDELEGLLSRLGGVLGRLHNHLQLRSMLSIELEDIFVGALVQLLNVLAICTKYVKKRSSSRMAFFMRTKDYGRALLGDTDVKNALEKLDELTREELLANTAQTLDVAQGIADKVELISGGVVGLSDGFKAVHDDLADLRGIEAKVFDLHLDKDICDWLAPPDPSQNHEERQTSHLAGTCTWFFDSKFEEWKNSRNGVYWIHGNTGTGKSVLCSSIIEHISSISWPAHGLLLL
ncbi:uncharacterized protein PHACADRAFT_258986 [Phanerochaete carnosa HHB-10118-sp]|uniref:Uncharacterized protein n=1 Tax=Phanerochaete carnosa (strain HHB-10118-sp) TaxID=650164 RepID=K5W7B7_PHACS|nr:uncharacterized protein PHACADRAFT_258986 [Phanerochaete carnosa HHB-10118-sp]EKM54844.1 hypothetical protein PHACADRAFT_258986 [Phanerochaete carnosa HHB-10118-sp]